MRTSPSPLYLLPHPNFSLALAESTAGREWYLVNPPPAGSSACTIACRGRWFHPHQPHSLLKHSSSSCVALHCQYTGLPDLYILSHYLTFALDAAPPSPFFPLPLLSSPLLFPYAHRPPLHALLAPCTGPLMGAPNINQSTNQPNQTKPNHPNPAHSHSAALYGHRRHTPTSKHPPSTALVPGDHKATPNYNSKLSANVSTLGPSNV